MDDHCVVCSTLVTASEHALQCDECSKWQHRECGTGITAEFYMQLVREEVDLPNWRCIRCQSIIDEPVAESTRMDVDNQTTNHNQIVMDESSLLDSTPHPQQQTQEEPTYRIISSSSTRGKDKLFDSLGYSYTLRRATSKSSSWRCSVRSKKTLCPASVSQCGDIFTRGPRDHIHPPKQGADVAAAIVRDAKEAAQNNLFKPASNIVEDILKDSLPSGQPCTALPPLDYLQRNVNYHRQQQRPKEPTDLSFVMEEEHLPDGFMRRDISVGSVRHVICASDKQLELLSNAKTWYMDGTFKIVSKPFTQLFTIHAFVKTEDCVKQLPLVSCLMSRRKKKDYVKVLKAVHELLPQAAKVKRIVIDFEKALWSAVRKTSPDSEIKGCAFHLTQAVWRKVQELGLQKSYTSDDGTHKFIRKLMALCFLPALHIRPVFERVKEEATSDSLAQLVSYIECTWITNEIWTPESWSVYMLSVRTNNDVEGWHNRLVIRGRPNMGFYQLVALLFEEAQAIRTQLRLISEQKLRRHQRKIYVKLQKKLFNYWEEFEEGKKSAYSLLKACARLYGPVICDQITSKPTSSWLCQKYTSISTSRSYSSEALPTPHAEGTEKNYSEKIRNIVNDISHLTLVEVADLNELLKKTLNISEAPMMAMGAMAAAAPAQADEEEPEEQAPVKMSYDVKLLKFDEKKKVALIKELKGLVEGMNLVQAKKFVESAPQIVKGDLTKDEAEKLKEALEAVGATVEIA